MNPDDETETLTLRSACSRCHGHKLRCVQVRGAQGCVRCTRAGVKCVARPSKRVRSSHRQGREQRKKSTRLEHSSSQGANRSGCRCMEQEQSATVSPSVRIADAVGMGQSTLTNSPLTPHTPANDFDVISYWETFESEDRSSSLPALEEEGNLNSLHMPREDFCFQPAIQEDVDVDVDVDCATLDPAALLLPSPASTDSPQEWNGHLQSTHSNAGHGDENEYFSQRGTTTTTTEKCEEQDRESNTRSASDWVAGIFTLNAKFAEHQRAMRSFIEACQRGFNEFNPHAMISGSNTQNELSPSVCSFLETTLRLAMDLLALVSEEIPSCLSEQVPQRTAIDAGADLEAGRSISTRSGDSPSIIGQSILASSLKDTANILLLLSCYTRLLGIFSSVFTCFHQIITGKHASSQSNPTHPLNYIHSFLPKVYIGTVSYHADRRLAVTMVLDLVQNVITELTRGTMGAVQLAGGTEYECTTSLPETHISDESGLIDYTLEQRKVTVSGLRSTSSASRTRGRAKASEGCGNRSLSSGQDCGASSEGVIFDSWRTTIQTVSSTALDTIRVLKDAIV